MSQEDEEFEFRARAEAEAAAAQPDASGPNAGLAAFATTPSDSSAPQGADGSGFGNWLKTQYGIPLARGAINAVTGLPLMAMDIGVASRNAIQSGSINATGPYELPSTAVQRAMNQYLPAPTAAYGKIGEAVNTGILGAGASYAGIPGLTAPTYGNVPPGFVSPSAREPNLTMGQEQAAAGGQDLGMRLTPGRETGSKSASAN